MVRICLTTMALVALSSLAINGESAVAEGNACECPPVVDCSGLLAETCRIYCSECYHCDADSMTEECDQCAQRRCDECEPYLVCATTTTTTATTTTGCPSDNKFLIPSGVGEPLCMNRLVCKANKLDQGDKVGACACYTENMEDNTRNKDCYRCVIEPNFSGNDFEYADGRHRVWAPVKAGVPTWMRQYWGHDEKALSRDTFRGFSAKCIACKGNTLLREDVTPPTCIKRDQCPDNMAIYNPKQFYSTCEKPFVCNMVKSGKGKYEILNGADTETEEIAAESHGKCLCGDRNCELCAFLSKDINSGADKEGICRKCKANSYLRSWDKKCLSAPQCVADGGAPTSDGLCDIVTTAAPTTMAVTDICADGTADPQACARYNPFLCTNAIVGPSVRPLCPALCELC